MTISLLARPDLPSLSFERRNGQPVASFRDSLVVVEKYLEAYNLTPTRLARLVGCGTSGPVFKWATGENRPSQPYLLRMCYLGALVAQGVKLSTVRTINWTTYEIEYFKGAEPSAERENVAADSLKSLQAADRQDNL